MALRDTEKKRAAASLVAQLYEVAKSDDPLNTEEYMEIQELLTPFTVAMDEYEKARDEDKKKAPIKSILLFRGGRFQVTPCGTAPKYKDIYEFAFKLLDKKFHKDVLEYASYAVTQKVKLKFLGLEKD